MKILHYFLITVLLTGLFNSGVCAQTPAAEGGGFELRALLATVGDQDRGKAAFNSCTVCHRKNASGRTDGRIPRLTGQHASVVIKQVLDIRAGLRSNPVMQPFVLDSTFTTAKLADIAAYLQSMPFDGGVGKGPGDDLGRGKKLYEQDCASCHGASGEGDAAKFHPLVAAQHYKYLQREIVAIRDGSRGNSNADMVKVVTPYTPVEIDAVADYMSQMAPAKP